MKTALREIKDWESHAACSKTKDPDLWFVVEEDRPSALRDVQEEAAKKVCKMCPVSGNCLDRAMENKEKHGVWGGLTVSERKAAYRGGSRASCPGCKGLVTTRDATSQICLGCGLSWLL